MRSLLEYGLSLTDMEPEGRSCGQVRAKIGLSLSENYQHILYFDTHIPFKVCVGSESEIKKFIIHRNRELKIKLLARLWCRKSSFVPTGVGKVALCRSVSEK